MNDNPMWYDADAVFPAEGTLVLVWDGLTYGIGVHDIEEGWEMSLAGRAEPTHWSYLPAPPK